jgi:glucose/mannose-6-phosphate isomerase
MMLQLIKDFPQHIADSLKIAEGLSKVWKALPRPINQVVITGLGGSGIGGTVAADLCASTATVPISVNKGYALPNWVGPNTLVVACSYSGNTEETLEALRQAVAAGCMVSAITSGGELKRQAEANGWNVSLVPGGNPPRSMFGYAVIQILAHLDLAGAGAPKGWQAQAQQAVKDLIARRDVHLSEADAVSDSLEGTAFAVYAATGMAGVATRWRQQLNENSKMPGWDAEVPEMNHNEMVGWAGGGARFSAVFLHSAFDAPRNRMRMELNAPAVRAHGTHVVELHAHGNSPLEQALDLVALGDWVSYVLSERNAVDIMDIKVIDDLKDALGKA